MVRKSPSSKPWGAEALLSQCLPGECWCAPVGTGMELVRKPTGIYWARGTDPNTEGVPAQDPVVVSEMDCFRDLIAK